MFTPKSRVRVSVRKSALIARVSYCCSRRSTHTRTPPSKACDTEKLCCPLLRPHHRTILDARPGGCENEICIRICDRKSPQWARPVGFEHLRRGRRLDRRHRVGRGLRGELRSQDAGDGIKEVAQQGPVASFKTGAKGVYRAPDYVIIDGSSFLPFGLGGGFNKRAFPPRANLIPSSTERVATLERMHQCSGQSASLLASSTSTMVDPRLSGASVAQ